MAQAHVEQVAPSSRGTGINDVVLIPTEFIKIIPYFDGDYRHLSLFIRKCNFVASQYEGGEAQEIYNMHVITSRLTDKAAALVSEREDIITWEQLRTVLTQHFGDPRSEACIAMKLETMRINPKERFLNFCNRIKTTRSNLFAKLNENDDEILRNSKFTIYNNTALNVFLFNLPEHLMRIVRLKAPETLEQALEIVLEEENFHNHYNERNKHYQPRIQQGGFRPNNIQPNLPQNFNSRQNNNGRPGQYNSRPSFNGQRQMQPNSNNRNNYNNYPRQQNGTRPSNNFSPKPATVNYMVQENDERQIVNTQTTNFQAHASTSEQR